MCASVADTAIGEDGSFLLSDALLKWGIADLVYARKNDVGGRDLPWRCRFCPVAESEDDLAKWVGQGVPCFTNTSHAKTVFEDAGTDGVEFVTNHEWNHFPKPRIAFKSGWGQPGSPISDFDKLKLVSSFKEVVESEEILNLQLFHRQGPNNPPLPCLSLKLQWPLPMIFGGMAHSVLEEACVAEEAEGLHGGKQSIDVGAGVVVDNATRLSKRGAVTWWHLDDGGEFVYQVALPLISPAELIGPTGRPVTKIFIFAPLDSYDLICQDDRTNQDSIVSALDLFNTPTHYLPFDAVMNDVHVPELRIALLEAGGPPLLSTPNVPHLVITVQTCVMVEQRRISKLFLDEVAYFMHRVRRWTEPPVLYSFITNQLRISRYLNDELLPYLEKILDRYSSKKIAHCDTNLDETSCQVKTHESLSYGTRATDSEADVLCSSIASQLIRKRAVSSLLALQCFSKLFHIDEETRSRVNGFLQCIDKAEMESISPAQWDDEIWCRVRDVMQRTQQAIIGVSRLENDTYCARIHFDGQPRFGPIRMAAHEAVGDLHRLQCAATEGSDVLDALLVALHNEKSLHQFQSVPYPTFYSSIEIMDELFD